MVLDKSYRMNTTQEFQILLRKLSDKTKRCLNSIERSAEEQKTVKEIPYTPFLRVKINVFLAHSGVFLWLEKHDWQLWDMTNWLKHPGEEHYFWAKSHKNTFSGIFVGSAWKVCYVAKGKIRWHFGVKLEINEPRKSFEVQPKISGDSLISKCFDDGGTQFIIHRYENYTFKGSLRI